MLDEAARVRPGRWVARRAARGVVGRAEAVHPQAVSAVHDLDAAAGGRPQAAVLLGAHDEHRAAALRERLHHLHAYRLDDAVAVGDQRRPQPGQASSTARSTSTRRRGSTPARSRTRRRPTRPSGPPADVFQTPGQLHAQLDTDEFRLYELIWQRTVASQMADARGTTLTLRIAGAAPAATLDPAAASAVQVVFSASGRTITFAGFLKAYVESLDEQAGGEADDAESRLPNLTQGQRVDANGPDRRRPHHQPARPLHRGVADQVAGRPRHRAAVDLLVDHQDDPGPRLRPQEGQRAGPVVGGVRRHRPARAALRSPGRLRLHRGHGGRTRRDRRPATSEGTNWLNNFYFGGEHGVEGSIARSGGLKKLVGGNLEEIDARMVNSIKLFDDDQRSCRSTSASAATGRTSSAWSTGTTTVNSSRSGPTSATI